MKMEEMTRIVQLELEHLPKDNIGSPQNDLRKFYNSRRRHDLCSGKTRTETLKFCLQVMKKKYPFFTPKYDKDFFGDVEKKQKKGIIQRFTEWRNQNKAASELLEVIKDEREISSSLESQLKAEREISSSLESHLEAEKEKICNLEIELEKSKNNRLEMENQIRLSKDRGKFLELELNRIIEYYLMKHLKEHKEEFSIEDYAKILQIDEMRIKEALESLKNKGKIRIA